MSVLHSLGKFFGGCVEVESDEYQVTYLPLRGHKHKMSIVAGGYIIISDVSYVSSVKFCKAVVLNFNNSEGDMLS